MSDLPAAGAAPDGITVDASRIDGVVIDHRRTEMGCLRTFAGVWLTVWTIGCVAMLRAYLTGDGRMEGGEPLPGWFVAVFWLAEALAVATLVPMVCRRERFTLREAELVFDTNTLGLRGRQVIPRSSIRQFVQTDDRKQGTDGEDSFGGWSLSVEGDRTVALISRQPYGKSEWLGLTLARWADVPYVAAPRPPEPSVALGGRRGSGK